jgi:hypothetical protein
MTARQPIYAHWLDGEYAKIAARLHVRRPGGGFTTGVQRSPQTVAEARLKLHALFGTHFALNDVQTIDSGTVLSLFADDDFVSFVSGSRDFLQLVAGPPDSTDRFDILAAGLERTQTRDWVSSAFSDPYVVASLSSAILKHKEIDSARLSDELRRVSPRLADEREVRLLKGFIGCLTYFASPQSLARTPSGPRTTFFEVLVDAARSDRPEPGSADRTHIETTLKFIRTNVPDDSFHFRSRLYHALDHNAWPPEHETIWNTAVSAWNWAVQESLGVEQGSAITIPSSACLALHRGTATDLLLPVEGDTVNLLEQSFPGRRSWPSAGWHPAQLAWRDVRRAFGETTPTRVAFQNALSNGSPDHLEQALSDHVAALAKQLLPLPAVRYSDVWLIAARLPVFFGPALVDVANIATAAQVGLRVGELLGTFIHRQVVANVLRGFADDLAHADGAPKWRK